LPISCGVTWAMIAATPWPPKLWLNSLQPTMPLSAVILRKSKARQMPSARSASMRSIFMGSPP
jgi:hypothetical protein